MTHTPGHAHPERDAKRLSMSANDARGLLCLYAALIVVGLAITVYLVADHDAWQGREIVPLAVTLAMALAGSGVGYARRLYKACINDTYTFSGDKSGGAEQSASIRRMGTLAFFLFRPLFGMVLSLVMYGLWRLSITASGAEAPKPEAGSLLVTLVLGFVSGFLAGRVLEGLESYGSRRIGLLIEGDE